MAVSTQQKILRVAAQLFAERGFADTNIREIADRSGTSIPTIYHHFGNKNQLYQITCTTIFGRKSAAHMRELIDKSARSDAERLLNYYLALEKDLSEDRIYFHLLHREWLNRDHAGQSQLSQESFGPAFSEVCRICTKLRPDRNPFILALSLYAMIIGLTDVVRFGVHMDNSIKSLTQTSMIVRLTLSSLLPEFEWDYQEPAA